MRGERDIPSQHHGGDIDRFTHAGTTRGALLARYRPSACSARRQPLAACRSPADACCAPSWLALASCRRPAAGLAPHFTCTHLCGAGMSLLLHLCAYVDSRPDSSQGGFDACDSACRCLVPPWRGGVLPGQVNFWPKSDKNVQKYVLLSNLAKLFGNASFSPRKPLHRLTKKKGNPCSP